jgi:hypothetical protein
MATARVPIAENWASGAFIEREMPAPPPVPTQFEITVHRLQLDNAPHLWPYDAALRAWVKANKNQRYVPEELLDAWGMHVHGLDDY